jgi:hypothetical protein
MDEWTGYRLVGTALAKLARSEELRNVTREQPPSSSGG